jgi:hypothetical protein
MPIDKKHDMVPALYPQINTMQSIILEELGLSGVFVFIAIPQRIELPAV